MQSLRSYALRLSVMGMFSLNAMAFLPDEGSNNWIPSKVPNTIKNEKNVLRPSLSPLTKRIQLNKKSPELSYQEDELSHEMALIYGDFGIQVDPDAPGAAFVKLAKSYVKDHRDLFGITEKDLLLKNSALLIAEDVQFVEFDVMRNGIVIADGRVSFRFNHRKLVEIVNHSFARATTDSRESLPQMEDRIQDILHVASIEAIKPTFRVKEGKRGYELIRVENFKVRLDGGESVQMQLESASGKVYEAHTSHYNISGVATADVYKRWYNEPLVKGKLRYLNIEAKGGTATSDHVGGFLADDGVAPKISKGLQGQRIQIVDLKEAPLQRTSTKNGNLWDLYVDRKDAGDAWLDAQTSQTMAYVHLNKIIDRAKGYISPEWFKKTLTANVNLSSTCNAHWDTEKGDVNFYSGDDSCANTGLIADVMYHEWGHGLHQNTEGIEDGALSEGFGDIMSLVMTHSPILGVGFRVPSHDPVRDLSVPKVYPGDKGNGEPHSEGLIIGTTFWDLLKALKEKYGEERAGVVFENFAFKMIYTSKAYTDVYNSLLVIDSPDGKIGTSSPNYCLINQVFSAHGLAKEDQSCQLALMQQIHIQGTSHSGIFVPGEDFEVNITLQNPGNTALSNLKGEVSLISGGNVEILDKTLTWDTVAPHQAARSKDGAKIRISQHAACGSAFSAKIRLFSANKELFLIQDFFVGKNVGAVKTFTATGLPSPIKDLQTTTSTLSVQGDPWKPGMVVKSAELKFDIRHTFINDITVTLTSPKGNKFDVFKGEGYKKDAHVTKDITSLVKGLEGQGDWVLRVTDNAEQDEGFLDTYSLNMTPSNFICQ